jgi:hypothetical protein
MAGAPFPNVQPASSTMTIFQRIDYIYSGNALLEGTQSALTMKRDRFSELTIASQG